MDGTGKKVPHDLFVGPFYVDREDKNSELIIRDARNRSVIDFGRYTQLPMDDKETLDREYREWSDFADWLVGRLNA